jgi:gamma-glutamylcyclotransferase (GGCT)/AIG2-like uncharacterized protein YtfP
LYEHNQGYPVLATSHGAAWAIGTRDTRADARTAQLLANARAALARCAPKPQTIAPAPCATLVHGQVLTFDSLRVPLAALDEYEGFRPGHPSLFVRALIDVRIPTRSVAILAWAYVAGPLILRTALAGLPSGRWRT